LQLISFGVDEGGGRICVRYSNGAMPKLDTEGDFGGKLYPVGSRSFAEGRMPEHFSMPERETLGLIEVATEFNR